MADIAIKETRNGSDFIRKGNDLELTEGLFNQVYLALFGGNIEGSTSEQAEGKLRTDWWGNELLFPGDSDSQFNSQFERSMFKNLSLGSGGITKMEAAMKADLAFLKKLAQVAVSVIQVDSNTVQLSVLLQEPETLTRNVFVFLWNGTKMEAIFKEIPPDFVAQSQAQVMAEGNLIIEFEGETFKFI